MATRLTRLAKSKKGVVLKSLQICEGCGDEFYGIGLFCEICGNIKIRTKSHIIKFTDSKERSNKFKSINTRRKQAHKEEIYVSN